MKCLKCASENSNTAKFCKGCGFDVQQSTAPKVGDPESLPLCLKCSASYTPGAKFCKACGTSTAAAAIVITPSPASAEPAHTPVLAPLPPSAVVAPQQAAAPQVSPKVVKSVSSPEPKLEPSTDKPNSGLSQAKIPAAFALGDTQNSSGAPGRNSSWNQPDATPVSIDPRINLKQKKTGPSRYVIGGSALAAVLVLAGAGAYWFSSSNAKPSAAPIPKQVIPPAPVATPAAAVPPSTPTPKPAEVAALPALRESPTNAVPADGTATIKTQPASGPDAKPATAAEAPPPTTAPVVDQKPSIADDQRRAKEAANRKRAEREALANQRARDKEKLNKTNRTLDDLLK
jgi:ribosomal protein L40E